MSKKRRAPSNKSSSNSADTYSRQKMSSTGDFSHSNILSREKMRVFMGNSFAWILILLLSLFAVILFYLSTNCRNNSLTQCKISEKIFKITFSVLAALFGVGQVFTRFWSDVDSSTEGEPRAAKTNEKSFFLFSRIVK